MQWKGPEGRRFGISLICQLLLTPSPELRRREHSGKALRAVALSPLLPCGRGLG